MSGTEPTSAGDAARELVGRMRTSPPATGDRVAPWQGEHETGDVDAAARRSTLDERRSDWERTVPRRFWNARTSDVVDAVRGDLETWATSDDRPNLVLVGAVGVGKTHAAVAACRHAFGAGATLVFSPVGELLDGLDWRRPESASWLEHLCAVDLLIVDDMGSERSNEWTGERLYLLINRRWLERRPTIATTNMTTDQMRDTLGERTYSRLAHDALALELTGEDRRRAR